MPRKWLAALLATAMLSMFAAGCGDEKPKAEKIQTIKDADLPDAPTLALQDRIRAQYYVEGDGTKPVFAKDFGALEANTGEKRSVNRLVLSNLSAGHATLGGITIEKASIRPFFVEKQEKPDIELKITSKTIGGYSVSGTSYEDHFTLTYRDKSFDHVIGTRNGLINSAIVHVPGRVEISRTSEGYLRIQYIASDGKEEKVVDSIDTQEEIYGVFGSVYSIGMHGHIDAFE